MADRACVDSQFTQSRGGGGGGGGGGIYCESVLLFGGDCKSQVIVEGCKRVVVYAGEESKICPGREINRMGQIEFG